MPNYYYLSLGSNITPEKNLPASVKLLAHHGEILAISNVYETPPIGDITQQNYLNAAVLLCAPHIPQDFQTEVIDAIEKKLQRTRTPNKYAPRTIDIDIILYNRDILQLAHRRIPSDEILTRDFVAIPMAELTPDYVHPETGDTLAEIAQTFRARGAVNMKPRPDVVLVRHQPPSPQ